MKSWFSYSLMIFFLILNLLIFSMFLNIFFDMSKKLLLEINFFLLNFLSVSMVLLIDKWSIFFLMTILIISNSVFIFSFFYMKKDTNYIRFHMILLLFVFSMILLIFSPGIFSLFLGWDGLGLSSFILVNFYSNFKSLNASILTFLTNRLGDSFFLCAIGMSFFTLNFNLYLMSYNYEIWIYMILFILGAFTKSAQMPFSAWLPAAMAAPTPVSSLVHSSTLVTAGIYLLFRMIDLLKNLYLYVILLIGIFTMIMSSLSALSEVDMKKIIALSTLSQLGLMVSALGLIQPYMCFFHLLTHAFFKALMFISVGISMYSEGSYQELKVMGSMNFHPLILGILMGANFSLCGMPFFSGFFSKEMIIQSCMSTNSSTLFIYMIFLISIILTQMYSIRFFIKTTLKSNYYFSLKNSLLENKYLMISLMFLLFPAIMTGNMLMNSWNLIFNFFLNSVMIKFIIFSTFFLSIFFSNWYLKSNFMKPKFWMMKNLWLLSMFSGSIFSMNLSFKENFMWSFYLNFLNQFISFIYLKFNYFLNKKVIQKSCSMMKLTFLSLILIFFLIF